MFKSSKFALKNKALCSINVNKYTSMKKFKGRKLKISFKSKSTYGYPLN